MNMLLNDAARWKRAGFSLVEVTIGMGIAAFSLVSVLGLLPLGSSSNRDSVEQTRAASIVRTIVSDLRSTPSHGGSSPLYKLTPAATSGSKTLYFGEDCSSAADTSTNLSRYRATIVYSPASGGVVGARVLLSWPAAVVPDMATGRYEVFTMLNAN